ncbi:hypothetical protein SCLCIDRAFT_80270, partial [Scleroderma citrinum Foug A]
VGHRNAPPAFNSMQVNGKFKLVNRIGGGSQGDVFCACDIILDEDVVMKLQPLELGQMLEREYAVYKALMGGVSQSDGPNLPCLHWYGTESGYHAMVLEHLGPSLEVLVADTAHKCNLEMVAYIGSHLITCLEFVHLHDFVHQDVKPS